MKILLLGGSGQFGQTFLNQVLNQVIFSPTRKELDLETRSGIEEIFESFLPDIVINASAWTNVVEAENQPEKAFKINLDGTEALALEAAKYESKFIHLSTDFVFDGNSKIPYTESSTKNPLSVYGESKSRAEEILLSTYPENSYIIRTSWLYSQYRNNFVKSILSKLMHSGENIPVVNDQIGSPTSCLDLVNAIKFFLTNSPEPGTYHISNTGETSRSDFASTIARLSGFESDRIMGVKTSTSFQSVQRPFYSALDSGKYQAVSGQKIPHWEDSLRASMKQILHQVESERDL
jgi:dTDP-4-dehydrorhamnose reductase